MRWSRPIQLQVAAIVLVACGALLAIAFKTEGTGDGLVGIDADSPSTTVAAAAGEALTAPAPGPVETGDDEDDGDDDAGPPSRFADRVPRFDEPPPPEPVQIPAGAPLLHRVPTTQPVAFITIDDGLVQHPDAYELMREADVPTSLFLLSGPAGQHRDYFARILTLDTRLHSHTMTHANLKGRPYEFQRREICGGAEQLAAAFGQQPTLFRPPGGAYDQTTLRAAADCGNRAVLHWSETVNNGAVQYQTPEQVVQPGDIILMHFRHTFVEDFIAALDAIKAAGLTPARLEDYLR